MAFISTKSNRLPAKGERVGDVYYSTDTANVCLVLADLSLLNLSALLFNPPHNVIVGPQGPAGRDGRDGESIVGPPGPPGKDGCDSTVPGPRGARGAAGEAATIRVGKVETLAAGEQARVENVGTPTNAVLNFYIPRGAVGPQGEVSQVPGPKGDTGPRGDVLVLDAGEIAAAAKRLRVERASMHAKILEAIADTESLHPVMKRILKARLEKLHREIAS